MSPPEYASLKNYRKLLDDVRYPHSVTNTLYFAFGTVPTGIITSLFLAVLINRQIRGIHTFRALFYLPVVSSLVSVSLIWLWMYKPQFGLLNEAFESLSHPRLKWLRSAQTAMLSIIILSVWKNMGLNMVIYLAGLQGIPPHLYEAAEIDGAGRFSTFLRITLPLLTPTTFFVVINGRARPGDGQPMTHVESTGRGTMPASRGKGPDDYGIDFVSDAHIEMMTTKASSPWAPVLEAFVNSGQAAIQIRVSSAREDGRLAGQLRKLGGQWYPTYKFGGKTIAVAGADGQTDYFTFLIIVSRPGN